MAITSRRSLESAVRMKAATSWLNQEKGAATAPATLGATAARKWGGLTTVMMAPRRHSTPKIIVDLRMPMRSMMTPPISTVKMLGKL